MADPSSSSLLEIWQGQINESMTYWQKWLTIQTPSIDQLTPWQSFMEQSYDGWSSLWQHWLNALEQWLTNWADLSGYTLQSNPPFGMLFPPLEELSRLNKAVIELMEQSTDSLLTGFGALAPGRAAELTEHVTQLEAAITDINQHLEAMTTRLETSEASDGQAQLTATMTQLETAMASVNHHIEKITERLETSDTSVTEQVDTLRNQMQTAHEATTQQLTALDQRLAEMTPPAPPANRSRSTTRRKPKV